MAHGRQVSRRIAHPGYDISQRIRKRIEAAVSFTRSVDGRRSREAFGRAMTGGRLAQDAPSRAAQGRLAIHPN